MIYKKTSFMLARPIWLKNHENEMNKTVIFETKATKGESTILRITAQNSYQVFINDCFVFFGPARAGHGFYRVDEIEIERYLKGGENSIKVLVCGYHCNNFYLINQQAFLCAELYDKNEYFNATGSEKWTAYLYSQKLQRVQRYAFQRPFCEVYDFTNYAPLLTEGLEAQETKFYDFDTFIEREVSYPNFPYEKCKGFIEGGYIEINHSPESFNTWWSNLCADAFPQFTNEEIEFSSTEYIDNISLHRKNGEATSLVSSNHYVMAEMNANTTGFIYAELECLADTTLLFTFDELLSGGRVNYKRMDCVNIIAFKLKGGNKYRLLTAEPYTLKYINAISLGGQIKINSLGLVRTDFNENEIIKKLSPRADEQIKRIYNAGVETFRQNAFDIYMDCPSRERAGWLCDSFFTSRVEYLLSGKSRVEHSFLSNFVMNEQYSKIPKGMLPMCYPADHTDGNFIPNWAMWYVIELREYLDRTNDISFVNNLKSRIYALLNYFRGFENELGFLSKLKGWIFVEWSECNNLCQDVNYPTNMLYYLFKKTISSLYNDSPLSLEADKLKDTIIQKSKTGLFFCDNAIINENGELINTGKCTETCQYYAFFTGIADFDTDKSLWDTLVKDFGPERKSNNKWEEIYFSNAFIGNYLRCDLLKRANLKDILEKDIRGYFDYMAKITGTLWEYDSPDASCNHGFASHVLIWLDYLGYIDNK